MLREITLLLYTMNSAVNYVTRGLFRLKAAAGKGKATLSGQNLRDTLLTQNINLNQNLTSSHYYAQLRFLLSSVFFLLYFFLCIGISCVDSVSSLYPFPL